VGRGICPDRTRVARPESPDEAEFYTSGRTSKEAAFLNQPFVRRFGTNSFSDCSNTCHETTSVGLPESIGIGEGTVILDDFALAEAIFVVGQNPGSNSPRLMTELRKAARRAHCGYQSPAGAGAGEVRGGRTRSKW
jgi:anaerobic selenocysteine-containing dehydrogenase